MAIKCDNIIVGGKVEEPETSQPVVMQGVNKEMLIEKINTLVALQESPENVATEQNDDQKVSQYVLDMYNSNELFSFDKYLDGKPI